MTKDIAWVFVIVFFVLLVISGIIAFGSGGKKTFPDVSFVDRKHAVFTDEEANRNLDLPFLMEITLDSETQTQALFSVTYFIPQDDDRVYSIGVYPESTHFINSSNHLELGENTTHISVNFKPSSVFIRGEKTEHLNVYIYTEEASPVSAIDETFIKRVYERRVIFPKRWRKAKPNMNSLNSSKFHQKDDFQ